MKYEKGEEKNEFFNSFINRVILYDDKVIILYNSNDRETKRLNKKQLKEVESGKNLEEIKENSSERKKFKRVAFGGEDGICKERKRRNSGVQRSVTKAFAYPTFVHKAQAKKEK